MFIRSLASAVSSSLILIGCAGGIGSLNQQVKEDTKLAVNTPSIPAHAQLSGCLRTQRDLTVSWQHRRYWCGNVLRRDSLQAHNIKRLATSNINSHYSTSNNVEIVVNDTSNSSSLVSNNHSVTTSSVMPASSQLEGDMVQYLTLIEDTATAQNDPVEQTAVDVNRDVTQLSLDNRVDFSRTREALDVDGIEQALSLIPNALHAQRITLLGLYEPDELTKVKPGPDPEERFSVGRSLSVREFWRSEGIDVSKVSILHHREDRPGRHVEVIFYD
jgi:hypothetical protein